MLSRRDFIRTVLICGGAIFLKSGVVLSSGLKDTEVKAVTLDITYTTEILRPPKRRGVQIWIPLPRTDLEQEVSSLKVTSPYEYRIGEAGPNRMLHLKTDEVKEGDRITMVFRLKRVASGTTIEPEEDPQQHLRPSEWERWDRTVAEFVERVAGKEKDPLKVGRLLYDAIIDRSKYLHEVCGRGVATLFLEEKVGRCDEFHALFRSALMYRGIPARWEQGIAFPYPSEIKKRGEFEADCINAHSWVRFYLGDGRWFPVDLSEAKRRPDLREYYFGRLVPNRMKVSSGRGLVLNPPQKGIINTFAYTYIEAGGLPVIYGHNYRNTINYKLLAMEV